MIAWTVIGIIVMLAAKQIVEAIFGQRTNVINSNADTLGDIGTGIFETSNIPIIYTVLNWIMGLATLVVLVLIIFQTFQLLTKPDSPDNITKIKKTLLYVAIGVLVIGTGYIISNVLLVNP
jgi:Na+-driven multidrug efflux pump